MHKLAIWRHRRRWTVLSPAMRRPAFDFEFVEHFLERTVSALEKSEVGSPQPELRPDGRVGERTLRQIADRLEGRVQVSLFQPEAGQPEPRRRELRRADRNGIEPPRQLRIPASLQQ